MGFGSGFSTPKRAGLKVISSSDGQVLRFHGDGKSVIGTSDLTYSDTDGFNVSGNIQHSGNIEPANDGVHTIGSSDKTYSVLNIQDLRAPIVTGKQTHNYSQ